MSARLSAALLGAALLSAALLSAALLKAAFFEAAVLGVSFVGRFTNNLQPAWPLNDLPTRATAITWEQLYSKQLYSKQLYSVLLSWGDSMKMFVAAVDAAAHDVANMGIFLESGTQNPHIWNFG